MKDEDFLNQKVKDMTVEELKSVIKIKEKEETKVIIIDNNPLSIAGYAEDYPENWKKICEALGKKEKDTWNLADNSCYLGKIGTTFNVNDIKTFIQKVLEDFEQIIVMAIDDSQKEIYEVAVNDLKKIISKRAGGL